MNIKPMLFAAGLLLALLSLSVPAVANDFDAPIDTRLAFQPALNPGGTLAFTWLGTPLTSPKAADLKIILAPERGAQKTLLAKRLTLVAGKTVSVPVSFPKPAPGAYKILSFLNMSMAGGNYTKTGSVRFVVASDGKVRLQAEKPLTARQLAEQFRPALPKAKPRKLSKTLYSGFAVRGNLAFTNLKFTTHHTTQTVETALTTETQPIIGAKVQICDLVSSSSFFFYQVLGTVYPDSRGNFSYYVPSNDDGDGTGRDIFLHVVADSAYCKVQDLSSTIHYQDIFPEQAGPRTGPLCSLDWTSQTMDLGTVLLKREQSGAWNILDAVRQGFTLVKGWGYAAPKATVRWAPRSTDGTYFDPLTKRISLLGNIADPDEFDDGVILHEYGHLVADKLSGDKSPGGSHYFDQPTTTTLAWSEGWATFFSCASRGTRFFVDTVNGSTRAGLSIDLEVFSDILAFDYRRGDDVEACVAAALWDIYDYSSDYRDSLSDSLVHIFPIVMTYIKSTRECTFRDFYNGWVAYGYPSQLQLRAVLDVFGINYWGGLMINNMRINNGAAPAPSRIVTLNHAVSGNPAAYMASESPAFTGAVWQPYRPLATYTLSPGDGFKRVFLKLRDGAGRVSSVKYNTTRLKEMLPLSLNKTALTHALPVPFDYDWFKLKVSRTGRYLIKATPQVPGSLFFGIFRPDNLEYPIYASAGDPRFPAMSLTLNPGEYVIKAYQELNFTPTGQLIHTEGSFSLQAVTRDTVPLLIDGPALTRAVPLSVDYDLFRLRVTKQQRYMIRTEPNQVATKLIVAVFKANDLSRSVFVAGLDPASFSLDINEIFPAGDYLIQVYQTLPENGEDATGTYTIRMFPYTWVIAGS